MQEACGSGLFYGLLWTILFEDYQFVPIAGQIGRGQFFLSGNKLSQLELNYWELISGIFVLWHMCMIRQCGATLKILRHNVKGPRMQSFWVKGKITCTNLDSYVFFEKILTMANTYTQIHIQVIIAVKYRESLISPVWKNRLHMYISGIVQKNSHKMIAINSMPDHLHLFFGFRPTQALSDLMRMISGDSSEWINKQKLSASTFRWQGGYGAFSYSRSQIKTVANYIENQEIHHHKKSFLEEYREFLKNFEIDFEEQYIFRLPE